MQRRFTTATHWGKRRLGLAILHSKSAAELNEWILNGPVDDFDGANCATAFVSYAQHRSRSEPVLKKLMEISANRQLDGWQLSKITLAIAKTPQVTNKVPDFLAKQITQQADTFNTQCLSNTMLTLAKTKAPSSQALIERLRAAASAKPNLGEFKPQELSYLVWSLATTSAKHQETVKIYDMTVAELEMRNLRNFPHYALINIMWAFAELDYACPEHILHKITDELFTARDLTKDFVSYDVATLVHALAKFNFCGAEPLLTELSNKVFRVHDMADYTPQELSRIVWAFAQLNYYKQPKVCEKISQLLVDKLVNFTDPQAIANALWGLTKLGIIKNTRPLCNKIYYEIKPESFDAQTMTNIIWSFSTLEYKPQGELREFSREIIRNIANYSSQQLIICLRAFATLKIKSKMLTTAICDELAKRGFAVFEPQDFTNLLWTCAKLGVWRPRFLQDLTDEIVTNQVFKKCTADQLVYMAVSLASLDISHEEMIDLVAVQAVQRFAELTPEQVVTLLWAFACWDVLKSNANVRACLRMPLEKGLYPTVAWASQLFQIRLACKQVGLDKEMELVDSLCKGGWVESKLASTPIKPSGTQGKITRILQQRVGEQEEIKQEAIIAGGIFVDIFFPARSLVIEVDGATHFLANGKTLTGKTKFKHRLLEREGMRVISLKADLFDQKKKNVNWGGIIDEYVKL